MNKIKLIPTFCLGITSGIPFSIVGFIAPYYLLQSGYTKAEIGILFLASAPYFLKPLYAPLFNSWPLWPSKMGVNKNWLCVLYLFLCLSVGLLSKLIFLQIGIFELGVLLFIVALCVSCVDVVFDGHIIEMGKNAAELSDNITAVKSGFSVGMLISGSGSLVLLSRGMSWNDIFFLLFQLETVLAILALYSLSPLLKPKKVRNSYVEYFSILKQSLQTIFSSSRHWTLLLLFILLYKVSDIVPRVTMPMLLFDLEFTPAEIGSISQAYGLIISIIGINIGGWLMKKYTINQAISIGAIIKIFIPVSFIILAYIGHSIPTLFIVITIQNLCAGAAGGALSIYLASICSKGDNIATSFAIAASLGSGARIILSTISGIAANYVEWIPFFISTAVIGCMAFVVFKMNLLKPKERVDE